MVSLQKSLEILSLHWFTWFAHSPQENQQKHMPKLNQLRLLMTTSKSSQSQAFPWILLKHLIPIFSASVFGCTDSPSGHWELHFVGRAGHPCHLHLHRGPATRRSCSRPRCIQGVVERWSVMVSLPIVFRRSHVTCLGYPQSSGLGWSWLHIHTVFWCGNPSDRANPSKT